MLKQVRSLWEALLCPCLASCSIIVFLMCECWVPERAWNVIIFTKLDAKFAELSPCRTKGRFSRVQSPAVKIKSASSIWTRTICFQNCRSFCRSHANDWELPFADFLGQRCQKQPMCLTKDLSDLPELCIRCILVLIAKHSNSRTWTVWRGFNGDATIEMLPAGSKRHGMTMQSIFL